MLLSGTLWVHGIPRLGALVGGRTPDRCARHQRPTATRVTAGSRRSKKNGAGRISEHGGRDPTSEEKATRPRAASQLAGFFV